MSLEIAPSTFKPSTSEGRLWQAHARMCPTCWPDGNIRDAARCPAGLKLRHAYVNSFGATKGRDWRAEALREWGPLPIPRPDQCGRWRGAP